MPRSLKIAGVVNMFDDYEFKKTDKRINFRFVQKRDEPMYPWEIAGFLNRLNTVYYKYELLNSICSAINHGISPKDIFVFDNSLPLYQRYSTLNLMAEPYAAATFYPIGRPYPLVPSEGVYQYNLLYEAFATVNSFLYAQHVAPLRTEHVAYAYEVLQEKGLDEAEVYIIDLAIERSGKSVENAKNRNKEKIPLTTEDLRRCLSKYEINKNQLLSDISNLATLEDSSLDELITKSGKDNRRRSGVLLAFFRYFEKTSRPLVCARVGEGKFRVLGRALVNKREQTGLELKSVTRNSPIKAVIEGGIAAIQAVRQDRRAEEIHQLEIKKKELEIETAAEKLRGQRLQNLSSELDVAKKLEEVTANSDIKARDILPPSFLKERIIKAYGMELKSAGTLLYSQGLVLESESITIIDVKA